MTKNMIILLVFTGIILAVMVLLSYYIAFNVFDTNAEHARTVALLTLICLEIVSAFNFRSFRKGVIERSLLVNKPLFYASIISLVLTFAIIYLPINTIFGTVPLEMEYFLISIIMSLILVLIFDVLKMLNNQKRFFDFEHM
jgi:Ca2+-transporting ATPase